MTTKMKNIKRRIGNLEFRIATYLGEVPENPSYSIDKWHPNEYYGKEKDFIEENNEFYRHPKYPNCYVHKDCFKNPESCYSIAHFDIDRSGHYNLHIVDNRTLDLNHDELKDFWELAHYGDKILNNKNEQELV